MSALPEPIRETGLGRPTLSDAGRSLPRTADALIEAGQLAERSGHRAEARDHYEAALYCLTGDDAGVRAATVIRWIARTHMTDADPDAALDCASAALAVAQACGDHGGAGQAINVQAAIHWKQGDLDTAERLFLVARASALTAGERGLAAMTSNNLGIIASVRGDLPEALHHYSVGLEHYRALARPTDICAALNNLGRLHTDLRQWDEAERAYDEAVEINDTIGDLSVRIGLDVNRAETLLARGDVVRAAAAIRNVLELSERTGETAWIAQTSKLQGILDRDAGNPVEADLHFSRAVEVAEARQDTLILAETLREHAELHRGQGRNREALQNLNRAHRLFTQLRARRELANVDRSMGNLEGDFIDVVKRWGESIEEKDRYTQGHCVRVADLSCGIALASGLDEQSLFWFRIGALLHDVGKLVVPSEVLNKPGKLTDEEWVVMRRHPSAGVEMLAGIDFPWDVRPIIESHHERWDGGGYPSGLAGEDIPLSARILCVADVYDALTSLRSYRRALSHDEAMEIMRGDVGTAFDPAVFGLFEDTVATAQAQAGAGTPHVVITPISSATVPRVAHLEADMDGLTGLPLGPSLARIAAQVLEDRRATGGETSLVTVDLDASAFTGTAEDEARRDRILQMVARQLKKHTRATDFLARTGDYRFVALLRDASVAEAELVASRVKAAVARTQTGHLDQPRAETVPTHVSVVTAPMNGETVDELFAAVDRDGTPFEPTT